MMSSFSNGYVEPIEQASFRLLRRNSCLWKSELLEQLLLELQHAAGVAQRLSGDQENVLGAVAERVDARRLQIDLVAREDAGHPVEQARAVGGDDREHLVGAALVG